MQAHCILQRMYFWTFETIWVVILAIPQHSTICIKDRWAISQKIIKKYDLDAILGLSFGTHFELNIKQRSFKSSEHISEKGDGPYRGFGCLSHFSDPIDLATWSLRELL